MSIQTEIDRIITAVGAAYDAIEQKGGTVPQSETVAGLAEAIGSIPVGGAPTAESDVNFYDYDGTLLYAWTLDELAQKTELPPLPSHSGLVCQGWNWSLAGLKELGATMDVGAQYNTDDGSLFLHIELIANNQKTVKLWIGPYNGGAGTIDWGDGSDADAISPAAYTQYEHVYAELGSYRITVNGGVSRGLRVGSNQNGVPAITPTGVLMEVNTGSTVGFTPYAFYSCLGLKSISIHNDTFPLLVTSLLQNCNSLRCAHVPSGSAYYLVMRCPTITTVTLGENVAFVNSGQFRECRALRRIRAKPSLRWTEGYGVYQCSSLSEVSGIFNNTPYALWSCATLRKITLGEGTGVVAANTFYGCTSLTNLVFPGPVTSIGANAFDSCVAMDYYDFTACTAIPTLANANAFTGIPDDCKIRVPVSLANDWKAATNWATYADHIVGVET